MTTGRTSTNRRAVIALGLLGLVLAGGWALCHWLPQARCPFFFGHVPVKVGILHSFSGTMAISETSVADATRFAIDELNRTGGLLGRRIRPVVADGRSDAQTFAREARRLIVDEKVHVVFGCWTSASRKTVKPIFEEHHHLLIYPLQHEGLEESDNIVYMGAAPNQQVIPAVKWCFDRIGERFFLVGSDYVFPRTANAIVTDLVSALGGTIVGEEYIVLGSTNVAPVIQHILRDPPDVIVNTINGDSNVAFFRALRNAGITPSRIPTMSFSIAEDEIRSMGPGELVGDYACWNYFQSVNTPANRQFIEQFRERYGPSRVTDDPMAAAYSGVHAWAEAVRDAGTFDVNEVRKAIKGQSYQAPEGVVFVDRQNNHVWRTVRIGQVMPDGQFHIVWTSDKPVQPLPYPSTRSKSEWEEFLQSLYSIWGNRWTSPGLSAQVLDERLSTPIERVRRALAEQPVLVAAVAASGAEHRRLSPEDIAQLDEKWIHAEADGPLVTRFLTNETAQILSRFIASYPQFVEVFVTDATGLNVAMTRKTSDRFQADEDWWQEAFHAGAGASFHGPLEYDCSAGAWGVAVYLPVRAIGEDVVLGVLKAFLSAPNLLAPNDQAFFGTNGLLRTDSAAEAR